MTLLEVVPIPVLRDNYAYLLIDTATKLAAAVDPVEAEKVFAAAIDRQVQIVAILTTHSHWDHSGGNKDLVGLVHERQKEHVEVIGGRDDEIPGVTQEVSDGDEIQVGSLVVRALHTPCHTRGHVLYHCEDALFTGDTLFVAGCGRFFEGTSEEMHYALNKVVAALPPTTKVYCGHEYTINNLRFAAHVEPQNEAIRRKLEWAQEQQAKGIPTIPSTIQDELATNPFMRVSQLAVQKFADGETDAVLVMGAVRSAKDKF